MDFASQQNESRQPEAPGPRHLYVAWVRFQRRPLSMRDYVGYELVHLPPTTNRAVKPLGYLGQAWRTLRLIRRRRPDVLWFQSPPSLLVYVAAWVQKTSPRRIRIVADCHNGALDPRLHGGLWARLPGVNRLMNGFDAVLAHNAEITEIAARRGIDRRRLVTLETRPSPLTPVDTDPNPAEPVVLVPCSFQADEPIDPLLDAAARQPSLHFKLTGNRARAEAAGYVARAPANVEFTGFLDGTVYTDLLLHADIVLGLTTVDGIQLSAANEAIGAGRPLVLSDTTILRDLFGAAAVFAPNTAEGLAAALADARGRLADLAARSRELKAEREARWQGQMAKVLALLA